MYGNNFEIETVGLQVVSFLVVCHEGRKINFSVALCLTDYAYERS